MPAVFLKQVPQPIVISMHFRNSQFEKFPQIPLDVVMWLTTVYRFIVYTLIILTTAHHDRGRPTLKDDERFRHGLVRVHVLLFS